MSKAEGLKNKVEHYFDEFSPKYHKVMHERPNLVLNRLKTLLDEINPNGVSTCLDLACGTGVSTLKLLEFLKPESKIIGIDISENMIDEANKIAHQLGIKNITYLKMDAEKLEFPDLTFDLVLSNMSFNYFPDKPKALREVCRTLRPGGEFAFSYTAAPCNQEGFTVAQNVAERHPEHPAFLKSILDVKTSLVTLENSVTLFTEAGLTLTNIYGRHSIEWIDPSNVVSDQSNYWSLYRQSLPPEAIENMHLELLEAAKHASLPGRGFKNTVYIIFAWGKRPLIQR